MLARDGSGEVVGEFLLKPLRVGGHHVNELVESSIVGRSLKVCEIIVDICVGWLFFPSKAW